MQVVESCKTVTGVIESIRVEQDGDYHIRLKMDPEFASLVNSANMNGQLGDLVVEPICQNPVSQQDAISACQDFHQDISIPPVGAHVKVTGSYVLRTVGVKLVRADFSVETRAISFPYFQNKKESIVSVIDGLVQEFTFDSASLPVRKVGLKVSNLVRIEKRKPREQKTLLDYI